MQSALFDLEEMAPEPLSTSKPQSFGLEISTENTNTLGAAPDHYRVLARKYRPSTFADMIGQEVLVTTLSHSLQAGRIAHAFVLTGIRGIGKTTTARIIARALNCLGADGSLTTPTIEPCGVCDNCLAIADDRHPDVIEMDAASHTGVNDIRELIDNARYGPLSARYKVYIIDEVHMLSNNAFNALLKTLEEPPAHAKFIFATTEIRKIPVTILSRCQRFDLKRVTIEELTAHYLRILGKEGYEADEGAIRLIASAASGSVRDGLSILDQAIASSNGAILTETMVRELLGLVDYLKVYTLFGEVSAGHINAALDLVDTLYQNGADPILLAQDMLEVVHRISRMKIAGANAIAQSTERELAYAKKLAESLPMSYLSRAWQMLLRGYEEIRGATQAMAALEMVLIRISYSSTMPTLEDLVAGRDIDSGAKSASIMVEAAQTNAFVEEAPEILLQASADISNNQNLEVQPEREPETKRNSMPNSLQEIASLCLANHEMVLYHQVMSEIQPIKVAPGKLHIAMLPSAPKNLATILREFLERVTNTKWQVEVAQSNEEGVKPPLHQQERERVAEAKSEVRQHQLVNAILTGIDGMEVEEII